MERLGNTDLKLKAEDSTMRRSPWLNKMLLLLSQNLKMVIGHIF
jgi:hypothetical protein